MSLSYSILRMHNYMLWAEDRIHILTLPVYTVSVNQDVIVCLLDDEDRKLRINCCNSSFGFKFSTIDRLLPLVP